MWRGLVFVAVLGLASISMAQVAPATRPGEGITEGVHRAALAWLDDYLAKDRVMELVPVAEAIADKLIAQGNLYAAGDQAFSEELVFRIGRLACTKVWTPDVKIQRGDVLLIGNLGASDKGSRIFLPGWIATSNGRFTPALTVYFGSANWPQFARLRELATKERWKAGLHFVDTGAPAGGSWAAISTGQLATVAVATALEAEVTAAVSRKGRTLAVYTSEQVPGGREFDKKIEGKILLDEPKLEPIPAGQMGRGYLKVCRENIAAFVAADHAGRVRAGAKRLADCQKRGGVIWTITEGHLHTRGVMVPPELSNLFVFGRAFHWEGQRGLHAGDTLLHLGFNAFPKKEVEACRKADADAVVVSVKTEAENDKLTMIPATWDGFDTTVEIPGYGYKAFPPSAVVLTPVWYSLMAETAALLEK